MVVERNQSSSVTRLRVNSSSDCVVKVTWPVGWHCRVWSHRPCSDKRLGAVQGEINAKCLYWISWCRNLERDVIEGKRTVSASVLVPWIMTAPTTSESGVQSRCWASIEMFRNLSESALALPVPLMFRTANWAMSRTSWTLSISVSGVNPPEPPP